MSAVSIQKVSKRYADLQALNNVEFDIQQGEFFGLLGPNGAGKSTLISALAGLVKIDSGKLSVMGHDVHKDFRQARKALGVVPQEIVYDPFFSVRESLRFQSGYYGIKNNDDWIDELLDSLHLSDKQDQNLRQLSGGMKRRVLIALALVHRPPVVVLDEPTAGVDVELRQSMWRFVRRLHAQGHTIVLTTHYLEEAEELCDRIAIINHGEIIALENKQDLLKRGRGGKLLVHTDRAIEAVSDKLQPHVLDLRATTLLVTLEQMDIVSMLQVIESCGVKVVHVSSEEDSLEDIFMQMTSARRADGVAS